MNVVLYDYKRGHLYDKECAAETTNMRPNFSNVPIFETLSSGASNRFILGLLGAIFKTASKTDFEANLMDFVSAFYSFWLIWGLFRSDFGKYIGCFCCLLLCWFVALLVCWLSVCRLSDPTNPRHLGRKAVGQLDICLTLFTHSV